MKSKANVYFAKLSLAFRKLFHLAWKSSSAKKPVVIHPLASLSLLKRHFSKDIKYNCIKSHFELLLLLWMDWIYRASRVTKLFILLTREVGIFQISLLTG